MRAGDEVGSNGTLLNLLLWIPVTALASQRDSYLDTNNCLEEMPNKHVLGL